MTVNASMRLSAAGLAAIKQWEGLRLDAYLCPAGVWTVGYGHTRTAKAGMRVTEEEADGLLRSDVAEHEEAVMRHVRVPLTQHQFDALVSFSFNVGAEAFRRSTLVRKLNEGDYASVPAELARWRHVGGRVVLGLVNRRAAEAGLWARGSPVSGEAAQCGPNRPVEVLSTDTGKASLLVGLAGLIAALKPMLDVLAGLPPWLGISVVVAATFGALVWRYYR